MSEVERIGGSPLRMMSMLTPKEGRGRHLLNGALVGMALYESGKQLYQRARTEMTHVVSVPGEDDIYDDVHAWVLDNLPSRKRRSLTVRSGRARNELVEIGSTARARHGVLRLLYDGSRTQTVTIAGHSIRVQVNREDLGRMVSMDDASRYLRHLERITFTARDTAGRDAVLAFLRQIAEVRHDATRARFYVATPWGDWRRMDVATRALDSVILRKGQREEIEADLAQFLASEDDYTRIGLPWHRGYLFHGPPGTGKTSLAKALAERFELDVHYVPLSDVSKDTNLLRMLAGIEQRSMLVLEDIDVVHAAKSRDDAESEGLTLSGLLNALDGMATPHGLVTVMTSNHKNVLDPALVRAGRVDRSEKLGYLDDDQLARLSELILGYQLDAACPRKLTHADLIEAAKPYLDDSDAAEAAMLARLQ